ncbi:hypothetical protein L596_024647 [Steinernema carpocapsae]|uniref:Uncharacterized protein n=1 Tax=Steinernema carpocapsae TaxID=34508 RepID=A0A4U5M5C2_STECR|nr:hypothetical protein L596_024647 [Steinernema carpocapsae]
MSMRREGFNVFSTNGNGVLLMTVPLDCLVVDDQGQIDRQKTVERAYLDEYIDDEDYFRFAAFAKQYYKAMQIWQNLDEFEMSSLLEDEAPEVRELAEQFTYNYDLESMKENIFVPRS